MRFGAPSRVSSRPTGVGVTLRALYTVAVAAGILVSAVPARAHLGHVVQRAERYLKLDLSGFEGRLVASLNLGPTETLHIMERADADGDGAVSAAERDAYLSEWARGLRDELVVTAAGDRLPVAWGDAYMQPIGEVASVDGAVELVGRFVVPGGAEGPVSLAVRDGMRVETFDRTDISFRARDGAELRATGLGESAPADESDWRVAAGIAILGTRGYPGSFHALVGVPSAPDEAIETAARAASMGADEDEAPADGASMVRLVVGALVLLALVFLAARMVRRNDG